MNETLLRQMDPADPPKAELSARARADLRRVLASEGGTAVARRRRSSRARLAVGLTAAAALAVAGVLAPSALRSGDTAFASWVRAARPLSAADEARAGDSCRQQLAEVDAAAAHARLVLADRRGDWTTVVLTGEGAFSGLCITDASTGWFRQDMIGSAGVATGLPPVGARGVVATDLGTGTMAAGDVSLAAGFVGPQVTAMTTDTESHGTVRATIADGRFALWFPGDELDDRDTVPFQVTFADGSRATVNLRL